MIKKPSAAWGLPAGLLLVAAWLGWHFWRTPALPPSILLLPAALALALLWQQHYLRRSHRQLQQHESYLASIIDNAAEAFITIDAAGQIGLFNHAAERMFGYSADEVSGRPIAMLMPEPYRSQHAGYIGNYLQRKTHPADGFEVNAQGQRKNGEVFPLHLSTSEFYGHNSRQFAGIIVDKSEPLRLEQALKSSEQRYRAVVDALTEGVLIHDAGGVILASNPAAARILERAPEQLHGSDAALLWQHGILEDGTPFSLAQQLRQGGADKVVLGTPRRDGHRLWLHISFLPLQVPGDASNHNIITIFNDITSEQQANEQVHLLLRGIESMSTGFLIADARSPTLPTVFVNDGFSRMTGYSKDEVYGRNYRQWQGEDCNLEANRQLDAAIANAQPVSVLLRNHRKDGSLFWNHMSLTPIYDSHNVLTHFVGEQHDISAQIEAAEAMQLNEQRWREALESTGMGVFEYDVQHGAIHFSPSWLALLGYTPDFVNGPSSVLNSLIHPDDVDLRNLGLRNLLSGNFHFVESRFRIRKADGNYCWVLTKGAVIDHDPQGLPRRIRGTIADINVQKEAEAFLVDQQARLTLLVAERTMELQDALAEAHSADRMKDEFIANMSHEIRTPMNAVIGFAELALHTTLTPQQHDYLLNVRDAAKSLLGIINDILDFSKYRSGRFMLDAHTFRLDQLCRQTLALVEPLADQKQLQLSADWPDTFKRGYQGDALRIRQILTNLLSNAIKFTEHGHVSLQGRCLQEDDTQLRCEFAISDSGIGMDPATRTNLFDPFMQADASTTRRFGGTGLGLAICKQLVDAMHGDITVDSAPGQGTTFRVTLTLPKSELAIASQPQLVLDDVSLQGRNILLVEDNAFNRHYACELLHDSGASIDQALNGSEAVEAVRHKRYDLVLMDMQMPVMGGLEATRHIRAMADQSSLPIIAMTASARPEDQKQALAAGMDDYLSKPIDLDTFWQTIAKWCQPGSRQAPPPPQPAPVPPPAGDGLRLDTLHEFDTDGALARIRGNAERYRRMLGSFAEHWHDAPHALQQSAGNHAWQELQRQAHTLKGSAGTIGAEQLAQLASQLESACEDADYPQVPQLLAAVQLQLELALQQIDLALGQQAKPQAWRELK